jgi:hypothetical protein
MISDITIIIRGAVSHKLAVERNGRSYSPVLGLAMLGKA